MNGYQLHPQHQLESYTFATDHHLKGSEMRHASREAREEQRAARHSRKQRHQSEGRRVWLQLAEVWATHLVSGR